MFAKFDEIPSLPFQDIKERPKTKTSRTERQTDGHTDNAKEYTPPPPHTHTNTVCGGGGITRSPKQDVDFHSLIGEREMKAQRKVSTLTTAL